jgi:hypothetical protein
VATQITGSPTSSTRGSPSVAVIKVAALVVFAVVVVVAAADITIGNLSPAGSTRTATAEVDTHGPGYPLHGGLAGPSRVSTVDEAVPYGPGYPLHGGLAGPSRVSTVDEAVPYGHGYPLHGGLAGPSRVDDVR